MKFGPVILVTGCDGALGVEVCSDAWHSSRNYWDNVRSIFIVCRLYGTHEVQLCATKVEVKRGNFCLA